jgi:hypothetical protein
MRLSFTRSLIIGILCVSAALLACKKGGGGPKEVKGSCDMRSGATGSSSSSSICIDFHTEPNEKVKSICTSGNYTLATTPCDHSTALGGCQKGNLTNWYYSSSRHSSADAVKAECKDGTFLAATP